MHRFAPTAAALFATGALLAASAEARAAAPVKLAYHRGAGAEECPAEEQLRGAVASRLGRDPFSEAGEDTLTIAISADGGVLRGHFSLERGGRELGAQTLETGHAASNCQELVDAIALEVALAFEAGDASGATEPAPPAAPPALPVLPTPPTEATATPPAVAPAEAAPLAATDSTTRPWSLWAGGGGRASVGSWAEAAFAPELGLEARRGLLGIGVDARVDIVPSLAVQSARATVVRPTGSLLGCAHGSWFYGCAVATFGATVVHGIDLTTSRESADAYAAFGGRGGLDLPLALRLRLQTFLELVGVATPTTVRIDAAQGTSPTVSSRAWDGAAGVSLVGSIL